MTYYVTNSSPMVFSTSKQEKVDEFTLIWMFVDLLKKEYEGLDETNEEDMKLAWENINWVTRDLPMPVHPSWEKTKMPTENQLWDFAVEIVNETEEGIYLQDKTLEEPMVPLVESEMAKEFKERGNNPQEYMEQEMNIADYLLGILPAEGDHEGPQM